MFNFFKRSKRQQSNIPDSGVFDEKTFYSVFISDLQECKEEIIIESPYITRERANRLLPTFKNLLNKGVKIYVFTRDPREHDANMERQSEEVIREFERLGIQTLLCVGNHHRKLAILDRKVLWEGSLNILSQTYSREIMHRFNSTDLSMQMFNFLKLGKFL